MTQQTRITFDVRVAMRDGVTLSADVYQPVAEGRYPAILVRTPYLKSGEGSLKRGRWFAEHGYVFVTMDVRGRGDSDGEFEPYRNDGRDGYDAIEWCAAQPWCNGNVGTFGGSYLGHVQWLAALEHPPHLKAMIVSVTPSDPFVEWPTGTPGPMHSCWEFMTSGRGMQNTDAVDWMQVYEHLPLMTMDEAIGRSLPNWRKQCAHEQYDEYWRAISYQDKFDQIALPVLHISGWYDDEQIGTPLNFAGMVAHAATPEARRSQKLLMGPWGHAINSSSKMGEVDFGPEAVIDLEAYQGRWFDRWLKNERNGIDEEPPVRMFVMGENRWRDEHEWPLARAHVTPFYFHSEGRANSRFGDGMLSVEKPADEAADTYRYDPSRPFPFLTDPLSNQIGGADDYSAVERRDDCLVYSSASLTEPVEVTGPVTVELHAISSAPDTDFMAMLLDVHPNGFVQRLCDGVVRARFRDGMDKPTLIEPGQVYRYTISLWDTAHVFLPGHQIRVQITSSAFPKYDRNLNTGESLTQSARIATADQRILHDAAHPSCVLLPVVPRD